MVSPGPPTPAAASKQGRAPRRAVVLGGTGFLGRRVVAALAARGSEVVVASRSPSPSSQSNGHTIPIAADITEPASLGRVVEGADFVANCVALYVESGDLTFESVHVAGAGRLAELAREAGADAFVQISGIGSDTRSTSPYVRSRGEGEAAVREAFPDATVLRPSVMFGPGDSFITKIASATRWAPLVPLFGSGETKLQPVHVGDVALAVTDAACLPPASGRTFELGGPEVLAYRTIVERVLDWSGRRRVLVPLPMSGWELLATATQFLSSPPITEGQLALMKEDNVVSDGASTLADLGIEPRFMADIVPHYVGRHGAS